MGAAIKDAGGRFWRGRGWYWGVVFVLLLSVISTARGAETIPPKPAKYFNDYTGKVDAATANDLNLKLEQFERDTSNQIRVVVYSKMQSDSSVDDYTVRVAEAWHIGVKGKNNGVILFVFVDDRKMFIQVGYGLEGALPDALCKRIIDEDIAPRFKATPPDYDGGLRAGVDSIIAATKGEYKGNGRTTKEQVMAYAPVWGSGIVVFVLFGVLLFVLHNFGGTFYQRHVRSLSFLENAYLFLLSVPLNLLSSGGSSSSGGGGSSGGGFSSSGGGSFGGGGAGGSW